MTQDKVLLHQQPHSSPCCRKLCVLSHIQTSLQRKVGENSTHLLHSTFKWQPEHRDLLFHPPRRQNAAYPQHLWYHSTYFRWTEINLTRSTVAHCHSPVANDKRMETFSSLLLEKHRWMAHTEERLSITSHNMMIPFLIFRNIIVDTAVCVRHYSQTFSTMIISSVCSPLPLQS